MIYVLKISNVSEPRGVYWRFFYLLSVVSCCPTLIIKHMDRWDRSDTIQQREELIVVIVLGMTS